MGKDICVVGTVRISRTTILWEYDPQLDLWTQKKISLQESELMVLLFLWGTKVMSDVEMTALLFTLDFLQI
ncbi:MAG: hypothetical protein IPJ66_18575 [Bacteroidetes bacterium]|nr:hypothetical protein [Bacteroidota bacterium]